MFISGFSVDSEVEVDGDENLQASFENESNIAVPIETFPDASEFLF